MTDQRETEPKDGEWIATGRWVAEICGEQPDEPEPLCKVDTEPNAKTLARIHNEQLAEMRRLRTENDELTQAHKLMAAQFETMRREKEHGWQLAEHYESERDEARARIAVVEALHGADRVTPGSPLVCMECGEGSPCPTAVALAAPVEQAGAQR